jgi:tetratricopeptide (TPR) repeat protein
MSAHLDRALVLVQQGRFEQALAEARLHLGREPEHGFGHYLAAIAALELGRLPEAEEHAAAQIRIDPEEAGGHECLARIELERGNAMAAETRAREALARDPDSPRLYALAASVAAQRERWDEVKELAERGLEIEPEHGDCANFRGLALLRLGRRSEAAAALAGRLQQNPESATAHALRGLTCLHQGKHDEAFEHFRESLRLEPANRLARDGLIEALKARYWPYRIALGYFLWVASLTQGGQVVLFLTVFFAPRLLDEVGRAVPALQPWTDAAIYAVMGFVMFTWVASPLFNAALLLHPLGRRALEWREIRAAIAAGLFTSLAVLSACSIPLLGPLGLLITVYWMVLALGWSQAAGARTWLKAVVVGGLTLMVMSGPALLVVHQPWFESWIRSFFLQVLVVTLAASYTPDRE